MKKILVFLLAGVMMLALAACGSSSAENPGGENENKTPVQTEADKQGTQADTGASLDVKVNKIQANGMYTYGLTPEGTLIATADPDVEGDNVVKDLPNYLSWKNIKTFSTTSEAIAAILEDGSVVYCGGLVDEMEYTDFSDVSKWKNVVQIAMGKHHLVALMSDGSVKIAGQILDEYPKDTEKFIQVEACSCPMGVRGDGTVAVWEWYWTDSIDDVGKWTDITSVSSTWNHIVALKSDGTVVACGNNDFGQCDVSEWKDIVAVSAGVEYTVGLKSDGTVVFCGDNKGETLDISDWTDIVEIDAGFYHCVGLRSDGTVIATGEDWNGQCDTADWKLK